MRRRTINKNRRRGSSGAGTPTQLLGDQLQLRVEPGRISPAARTVYGVERYTDPLQSGTPRQLLPKYGLTLNGSTEYATGPNLDSELDNELTFCLWLNTDTITSPADYAHLLGTWSPAGQKGWLVDLNGSGAGVFGFTVSADGGNTNKSSITSTATASIGTWVHVCARFSSGVLSLFVNGIIQGSQVDSGTGAGSVVFASGNDVIIGASPGTPPYHFDGSLDDIRIYDTALTDSQIADIAAIAPGSQRGANVGSPLIHYKCEDPVTSATLRNSGSLGSAADATITTAAIATVRGTASPVYSFANSVGGSQAWCSDGVDDHLDTQITLDSATALTVYRRLRYLSENAFDLDGFANSGGNSVNIGRNTGDFDLAVEYGGIGQYRTPDVAVATNVLHTQSLTSTANGNFSFRQGGYVAYSGTADAFTSAITNSRSFLVGARQLTAAEHFSHTEYYEYLIADRVLTDDELTWLETGGQSGTAIDFEGDANILLYTDFSQQTATQIVNQANPNLPILKASGSAAGELTMVPRSEADTTKDIDQADYSYRTAVKLDAVNTSDIDLGAQFIPSSGDFSFSLDFMVPSSPSVDDGLLSQYASGQAGRFWLSVDTNEQLTLFCNGASNLLIQSGNNAITLGKWHNAEVTRVGNVFTLSLDGVVIGTQTVDVTPYATNTRLLSSEQTGYFPVGTQISKLTINGNQYLTTPNETISGATLTNASYVNVVRGKPGTIQHTGIAPRDMPLSSPCVTLNGTNEIITLPISLASAGAFKVSMWLKTTDAEAYLFDARDANDDGYRAFFNGDIFFSSDTTDIASSGAGLDDGEWHFIEIEWDGATGTVKADGNEIASGAMSAAASLAKSDITIGEQAFDNTRYLAGQLSEVVVTVDGTAAGNYPLTEGAGNVAHDVSGNGNHGTINGTLANIWANQTNTPGSGTLVEDGYSVGTWFDGANDYFVGSGPIGNGSTKLSVGAILNPDLTADTEIASCAVFTTTGRIWRWRVKSTGVLSLIVSVDGTSGNSVNYESVAGLAVEGSLHQYDVTFDGSTGTCKFYKDGVLADTVVDVAGTGLHDTATDFVLGNNASFNSEYSGVMLRFRLEPDVAWSADTISAIQSAVTPQQFAAISSGVYYSPEADGGWWLNASQQTSLSLNGAPEQRVIPAGTGLPAISYGPGLLPPNCSLDLYCNEDDAPFSQGLAALLTDGDYDFNDGGPEGDSLFRKGDANGEELAVIKPAATGAELTILEAWDSD